MNVDTDTDVEFVVVIVNVVGVVMVGVIVLYSIYCCFFVDNKQFISLHYCIKNINNKNMTNNNGKKKQQRASQSIIQ